MIKRYIFDTPQQMGKAAADQAAGKITEAIESKGRANIILATGASQFQMLENLVRHDIDWSRVVMFHLDEYIGLDDKHPASFCKYLRERFAEKVKGLKSAYFINGIADDPEGECSRLNRIISDFPIDAAMVGIGENGHLAFNDPPADFEISDPYIIVNLDEACRRQQLGEGWFETFQDVPTRAISMSIRQIMKSKSLIVTVPDERKAKAVKGSLEGEVTNTCPASIIQEHPDAGIFLDRGSASLLES